MVADGDHPAAGGARKVLGMVKDAGDAGSATRAFAHDLVEAEKGAEKRRQNAENDQGNAEKGAD